MSRQRTLEKIETAKYVTIGELVRLSGVRYSTLKYFSEEGLLPFEQAEENLTRRYPRQAALSSLAKIKQWKTQGYTIMQIKAKMGINEKRENSKNRSQTTEGVNNTKEREAEQESDNALLFGLK